MPSYASGAHIPRKPSSPRASITSRAKCPARSHSAANGSIRVRANSRASSTIWRCVSVRPAGSIAIDIESTSALPPQPPRRDHLPQQRRRPVLVVTQIALQHLQDRETHVQADQVGERERPQRMVHAQLHHRVHGFRRRHTFHYAEDGLVDHRHEDAVGDEPGGVMYHDWHLLQHLYNLYNLLNGLLRRLEPSNHLHQRHHRHRVHEVHPDHLRRTLRLDCQRRDRDRRRVAREDRPRWSQAIEVAKDLELDVGLLGRRFDDELHVAHGVEAGRRSDARQGGVALLRGDRSLLDLPLEVRPDLGQHAFEQSGRDVDQGGVPAVLREHVRDAVAHRPGAHYRDPAHATTGSAAARAPPRRLQAMSATLPATMTSVDTMPPSGPNAPPSIQPCGPGRYAKAGSGNAYPLTGAANTSASVAFHPKWAPHASGMPPGEKKAHASHTPASATLTVEKGVALGLPRCASPNPVAAMSVAGVAPIA